MKNIKYISLFLTVCMFVFMSCENDIDNYDAPNGGIKGTIYDETTNEPIPLPVQGEAGVMVNLFEQNTGATEAINFRAKQDGTYEHSKVFNCEYKVVVDGPFTNKCEGCYCKRANPIGYESHSLFPYRYRCCCSGG